MRGISRSVAVLVVGGLAATLLIGLLTLRPGKATVTDHPGDARISFAVDRRWVVEAGACVTVHWDVSGIESVFLNGGGRTGTGAERYCIDDAPHTFELEVHLYDGTTRTYLLKTGFMSRAPEIWLLAVAALTQWVAAIYLVLASCAARSPYWRRVAPVVRAGLRWTVRLTVSLCVVLVGLEVGLRAYFSARGTETQREKYLYSDADLQRIARQMALPYLNYLPSGNNLGYRGPDIALPKPDGVFRVVLLGDSNVYGLGIRDDQTLSARLQAILRAEYGYPQVEVINAGGSGQNTWSVIVNLAFRVLELEPDLLIEYQTVTDVGARIMPPDCYASVSPYRGVYPRANMLQLRNQVPIPSTLVRFVAITLGWMDPPSADGNFAHVIACADQPNPPAQDALTENPPTYFERNLRTIVGIAKGHGVPIVLMTWAYDARAASDPISAWWAPAAPEHNAIVRRVAGDLHVPVFDLAASELPNQPDLWAGDQFHFNAAGYDAAAHLLAAYLVEQPDLLPPLEPVPDQ